MSSPLEPRNPFDNSGDGENLFAAMRNPSAWQAHSERKHEEQTEWANGLVAAVLEFLGVAVAASVAASTGMESGALVTALFGTFIGLVIATICIGVCVAATFVAAMGSYRHMVMPVTAGIFLCTTMGAALGAHSGQAGSEMATSLRALFGGAIGLLPAGCWWLFVRHRAGKRCRGVIAFLATLLILISVGGFAGFLTGAMKTGYTYDGLVLRGNHRRSERDLPGAFEDFSRAIELEPNFYRAYEGRCLVLVQQGKEDEARKDYQRCVTLYPPGQFNLDRQMEDARERRWK